MKRREDNEAKTQNYKFFSHSNCEYFPCHDTKHPQDFNCIFCYCPLYVLDDKCGGNFTYTKEGYKDCSRCMLPHKRENYEYVAGKFKQIAEVMSKTRSVEKDKG